MFNTGWDVFVSRSTRGLLGSKDRLFSALLFCLVLSTYFQRYYIDIGFALKPFMIFMLLIPLVYLVFEIGMLRKTYVYERWFLLFLLYSCLRGYFSSDVVSSFRLILGFAVILTYYSFVSNLAYRLDDGVVVSVLLCSGSLFLLVSLVSYFVGDGWIMDRGIKRLIGSTIDPNIFVVFASLTHMLFLHKVGNGEIRFVIGLLLSATCIILSVSRGGILATTLGTMLFFLCPKTANVGAKIKKALVIVCCLTIVYMLATQYMNVDVRSIVVRRFQDITGGSGRANIWDNALKLFRAYPLFGVGLYNFQHYNLRVFGDSHYAHNTYLEILVEGGLIGAVLFAVFFIAFVLDRPSTRLLIVIKLAIYMQLISLFFLTGLLMEPIYLAFALYKGIKAKDDLSTLGVERA